MKRIYLMIISAFVPILAAVILVFSQCDQLKGDEDNVERWEDSVEGCEDVLCLEVFMSISLKLKYADGQPVLLDSSKVFWVNKDRYLQQDSVSWNESRVYGNYVIVNDRMKKELKDRQEIMQFTGYLNGEIVCERDVLVGADCCHVICFETEPMTHVIYGISDDVRESKFCELVNVERIRSIIPSYHYFIDSMNENLQYENKLQLIVEWFLSHGCITNAHIGCVQCVPTYQGSPNNSRISFSFIENGQTVNMVMLVTGHEASFAGFL